MERFWSDHWVLKALLVLVIISISYLLAKAICSRRLHAQMSDRYPVSHRNIWNGSPQLLHGPDNHPFFDSYRDPEISLNEPRTYSDDISVHAHATSSGRATQAQRSKGGLTRHRENYGNGWRRTTWIVEDAQSQETIELVKTSPRE